MKWFLVYLIIGAGIIAIKAIQGWRKSIEITPEEEQAIRVARMNEVPRMTGQRIGMDFLVADLNGTSTKHDPVMYDVLILLRVCSMGMDIQDDQRGLFSGHWLPQPNDEENRLYDTFHVTMENGDVERIKRYELRPCGLAKRTWVVAR